MWGTCSTRPFWGQARLTGNYLYSFCTRAYFIGFSCTQHFRAKCEHLYSLATRQIYMLDIYKQAAGSRYGSVDDANSASSLSFLALRVYLFCRCNCCVTCLCHITVTDIGIVSRDISCTVSWGKNFRQTWHFVTTWQALWRMALFRPKLLHFWKPKSGFSPDKHM